MVAGGDRVAFASGFVPGAVCFPLDGSFASYLGWVPFSDLPGRVADIPEIWVYCRTGYRAVVAASILAAAGRQVISIDDEFDHAHDAGLTLMRPGAEPEERPR